GCVEVRQNLGAIQNREFAREARSHKVRWSAVKNRRYGGIAINELRLFGVCVRVEAPIAAVVADPRICHVAGHLHGGFLCPYPPQGCRSVGWLPVWLPSDRKRTGIRTLNPRPE